MFTGIVEEVGRIVSAEPAADGRRFRIAARVILEGLREGDSVAVDGVCLTVAHFDDASVEMVAVATTLGRTTLGERVAGDEVNLERALRFGDRVGGHLVQGHVDGTGVVKSVEPGPSETRITLALPPDVAAVTVPRGSLTVQGVSLTVSEMPGPGMARIALIPYTLEHTTLRHLQPGARVNLEGDLLGRYVLHWLEQREPGE